ncbi:GNAT family N-acetyltransferase [Xanthomonas massiliensis]|jgi:predicted N-acyltransferase|uniref:GNAT family N-acetyltransferase n=1 Tax=Xanthomonas massiliensis TaxID=1720302 RepID=UPI00082407B0|nr:GNAT family N-acetyltransferase [Xanthomonas massiliensis]
MSATVRWIERLDEIPAQAWDGLHDGTHPFVRHAFLSGLEQTGCLRPDWGWQPHHATLWDGGRLRAAAPGYVKTNSHGEFVFDHAWAHAWARYGQDYFPKWLCAVPYTPVTGPRLLAPDPADRAALLQAMAAHVDARGWSSAHVNFPDAGEDAAFPPDWLARIDVQFHWRNPGAWRTFDDCLAAMDHKHRKNIRQERARVARAGIVVRQFHGDQADAAVLDAMYGFYLDTFREYGNAPALTRAFLDHLARRMPEALVIFMAFAGATPVAGALCLRGGDTLYGRYWGGAPLPGLHFETCYYQGIEYCLRHGLSRFEPGAQGEHKIARGFLPAIVHSRHWIADQEFRPALERWCAEEADEVRARAGRLARHSPFRAEAAPAD